MFDGWTIAFVALVYVFVLFCVAWIGDRIRSRSNASRGRPLTYALSLAIYCTSWTFFGSVGLAAATGYDFLPVYVGPILLFLIGWPFILRVVRLAKSQNITSVADFLAARYGKSQSVAAVVTIVAVVGSLPYIALQLKAIAISIEILLGGTPLVPIALPNAGFAETSLVITIALAVFAILFGTRHIDATEHQDGLMLAIAAESLIKLAAFLAVGTFVTFSVFSGPGELIDKVTANPAVAQIFGRSLNGGSWLTVALLSSACVLLLPRQFHVVVVENRAEREVQRAAWMFPLYLVAINLFVVPIAAAGLIAAGKGASEPDFFVLSLPIAAGSEVMTLIAFVGGLSAATAMVIMESIALAIMVCNGLVIPALLHNRLSNGDRQEDMATLLLTIRRFAIVLILALGYLVYHALGKSQGLAAIGLISFAAIAQLAPAFLLGLIWRKGTARGAIGGILAGFGVWAYTLVLPWIAKAGWVPASILTDGPLGLGFLRPQALLYLQFEPLTHGVLWSIGANVTAYLVVSLLRAPEPVERVQAQIFVQDDMPRAAPAPSFRLWRSSISVGDLQHTVGRYLGAERSERSFAEYLSSRNGTAAQHQEADIGHIRFAEHLLTSAIGAASARLVLSLLLRRGNVSGQSAMKLLDDASEALQYNRDLLQSALDQVRHGLAVFDKDMRLICWNRQFRELLNLPSEYGRVGVPVDRILRFCAERGDLGESPVDELVAERLMKLAVTKETFQERMSNDRILEIRTAAMPQGGVVATYLDITDRVAAANALARANETLERRVRERTAELLQVNAALAVAKAKADEANLDKTRFIAAASHDILQPLNAARLYATSLTERPLPEMEGRLARNVDASLSAVEEIFGTLIDISRLDAGRMEPELGSFPLAAILDQLKLEFAPMAREKGLRLDVAPTSLWVRSDRRLLRRLLQNLLSNAIKYTPMGRVLVGARRHGDGVRISVLDTGPGIPDEKQSIIFKEFERLDSTASSVRGLGLGLSIVERIARVLDHRIEVRSTIERGSSFAVVVARVEPSAKGGAIEAQPAAHPPGSLAGAVILCVDNEPAVLDGMALLLRGWGCTVLAATTTPGAVDVVRASTDKPQAILADYHLDEGIGLEAIEAVRAECGMEIPAVVITADHSAEVQRSIRWRGISMLRKPLRAAALRALLTQHLTRRAAAAE